MLSCKQKEAETADITDIPFVLNVPDGLAPIEIPNDNPLTKYKVMLGEKMFFDKNLSSTGLISCSSCHKPSLAFADSVAVSSGVHGRKGIRNTPSILNVAYKPVMFMDGGSPTIEQQVVGPITDSNEMNLDYLVAIEKVKQNPKYRKWSNIAFGRDPDAFVFTRSIAAYQRTLLSGTSKYDKVKQAKASYTASEQRGKDLFYGNKANCANCHSGEMFTNYAYENIGLYQEYMDKGRARITLNSTDNGKFIVPSLRNVALTAPYMHNGSIKTLTAVVDFFNIGGANHPNKNNNVRPLNLTTQEKSDLVAFMKTLSDNEFIAKFD